MGSFWAAVIVIGVVAVSFEGIVRIIKASKSASGSKKLLERISLLEAELSEDEQLLEDAVSRIEVLERIVTDDKYSLGKEIDDLASGQGG
jgi:hypothetical protein